MGNGHSSGARVEAIYIAPTAAAGMRTLQQVEAIAGQGLEGDRYLTGKGYYSSRPLPGGGRQLTLIESEVLEAVEEETGVWLDPSECRRNIVTRAVPLNGLQGKQFYVGEVLCEAVRQCDPCKYLEELTGKRVLKPLVNRGGLRAKILTSGPLRTGDRIQEIPSGTGAAEAEESRWLRSS